MKNIISREVLLSYPDFEKTFHIYTDASHTQLGAVITQDKKPIAFYSRKLNEAQTRYTTTERELLSIVETLKEFRTILLGMKIIVHTDHQNLTYVKHNTERVMRWRLLIEEYGRQLVYIKGKHNEVADAFSRLPTDESIAPIEDLHSYQIAEAFGIDKEEVDTYNYPLSYKQIAK